MEELFKAFDSSVKRFEEVLAEKETIISRDASIQRFEFTVELAWKCIQKLLKTHDVLCRSPKECLKSAFEFGLIQDDPLWLQMMEDRNLTSHTYQEATAENVYKRLPAYLEKLQLLQKGLKKEFKLP